MTKFDNVHEDIEVGVEEKSLQIPVRVKMSSINEAPFDYTASIDEVGQIILTPTSLDMKFEDANTDDTVDYDVPVVEQETITSNEGSYATKETTIIINATMLVEADTSTKVSADIDEIGQCVIYPMNKNNSFTTVTMNDSLNLITEDFGVQEYCDGYKLINSDDYWYVKSPSSALIGQGFSSANEAKIFVCETEIARLKRMNEETEESDNVPENEKEDTTDTEESEPTVPSEVEAEVITESVSPEAFEEFSPVEIEKALAKMTVNFTEDEGGVRCDTQNEQRECEKVLSQHYSKVELDKDGSKFLLRYSEIKESLNEAMSQQETIKLLIRFLQGDITLVTDVEGEPKDTFIHLKDVDTSDSEYWYDPESDAIGVYKK